MNKALLDTDILSEIGKGKNPAIVANAQTYRKTFGFYSFSTITALEIVRGYQKSQQSQRFHAFMAIIAAEEVFPLHIPAAELAGRITGDLERAGQPIGRANAVIAAIGIEQGLEPVTGNTTHFQRIQQLGYPLTLINWH